MSTYPDLLLLNKVNKGCPLHLHGLPLTIIEGQHEVEKVALPEVARRLLLKMRPTQANAA